MNILKTHTLPTAQADTFLVYWTNSLVRPGGLLKVRVNPKMEDAHIAAELAALQHLLEDKCVVGQNIAGNASTRLIVSLGAIKKLHRMGSEKAHLAPYANFLTTRFAGCQISVDKDTRWFDGLSTASAEDLLVGGPRRETVKVAGLGNVSVTQHVLQRFAGRFLPDTAKDKIAQSAWKKLVELASDPLVREVSRRRRRVVAEPVHQCKPEGRYFLNARRNLVLVVTNNPGEGMRLVTTYPANQQFHERALAA